MNRTPAKPDNLSMCIKEQHLSLINALRRDRSSVDLLAEAAITILKVNHDYASRAALKILEGMLKINDTEIL